MYFEVIPKATDEYLRAIEEFKINPTEDNPIWHIYYNKEIPSAGSPINFGMLLNLVSITNTSDPELIWQYIKTYQSEASKEKYPVLDDMIQSAIVYYEDKIYPNKKYKLPSDFEKSVLQTLIDTIKTTAPNEELLTAAIYEIGKNSYGTSKLREFFQMIYEVLMGQISGPRFPVFVLLYGIDNTVSALEEKLK
ncbi:MAG: hypothetical protein HC836_35585 [Richelia sp. RM2_1_2]|nr:hypothetical protein [Richelia sp. RM2_1_2]